MTRCLNARLTEINHRSDTAHQFIAAAQACFGDFIDIVGEFRRLDRDNGEPLAAARARKHERRQPRWLDQLATHVRSPRFDQSRLGCTRIWMHQDLMHQGLEATRLALRASMRQLLGAPVPLFRFGDDHGRTLAFIQFGAANPARCHSLPHLFVLEVVREFGHQLAFRGVSQKLLGGRHRGIPLRLERSGTELRWIPEALSGTEQGSRWELVPRAREFLWCRGHLCRKSSFYNAVQSRGAPCRQRSASRY
jgi:hypothetical protein